MALGPSRTQTQFTHRKCGQTLALVRIAKMPDPKDFSSRLGKGNIRLTGDERKFGAVSNGRVTGTATQRTLTVTEYFACDDGQKNRLTWIFRETGPGRWSGKRADTVGEAVVIEANGQIRLTCTADSTSFPPNPVARSPMTGSSAARAFRSRLSDLSFGKAAISLKLFGP